MTTKVLISTQKNSLSSLTDELLIELVNNNNDSDAFKEICRRYENIFYKVCQKYITTLNSVGINTQDIFDEKTFIIFHCIKTFKPTKKTKLSTWIGNYARYLCLNSISSRKFILPSIDEEISRHIEEAQIITEFSNNQFSEEDYNYILNIINQLKDKRVSEIFKHRYFSEKKMIWTKIAKELNMSTQTAINLHNKGISILRKKVKSRNISDVV